MWQFQHNLLFPQIPCFAWREVMTESNEIKNKKVWSCNKKTRISYKKTKFIFLLRRKEV